MTGERGKKPTGRQEARIILVEREPNLEQRLRLLFPEADGAHITRESSIDRVLERFESDTYDVLIITGAAFKAGEVDGIELLDVIAARSPGTQVLFVLAPRDIGIAMSALKAGAYAYARLPVEDQELRVLVKSALEKRAAYGPMPAATAGPELGAVHRFVGQSESMQRVFRQIRQAATTDIPVLITGETGTGKDLAAQAIHEQSARCDGPFVPVHLGAIPAELIASELFGYEKGAFTGANRRQIGRFEQAQDGTIFLDEISTMDEKVQISLLRLLGEKKFSRLGGRRTITSTARLIAATNEDLAEAVSRGRFREDLYYRLDIFRIAMPLLRDRPGDIPLLIDEFLKRYNASYRKEVHGIAPEAVSLFESYHWPGHVRELKNVIQRGVLVCSGNVLLPEHLPPRFRPDRPVRRTVTFDVGTPLDDVEREMVVQALAAAGNNRKRAAELLGISRRALYNKLRKHSIE